MILKSNFFLPEVLVYKFSLLYLIVQRGIDKALLMFDFHVMFICSFICYFGPGCHEI